MTNNYHRRINLDFDLDYSHFEHIKTRLEDPSKKQTFTMGRNFIDEGMKEFVARRNCTVVSLTYFHTPPGQSRVIHSDNTKVDNFTKINFVFNGVGSVMKWWKLKDPNTEAKIGVLPDKQLYKYYVEDQCVNVETAEILTPTMLNAGALHSLENFTNNYRWAISFLLGDENYKPLQWDDAMIRFASYLD